MAGEAIHLKDGFKAQAGTDFHGYIEDNPHEKKGEVIYAPKIKGNKYVCGATAYIASKKGKELEAVWELRGDEINYFSVASSFVTPVNLELGQYTLYCEVEGVATSKVIEVVSDSRCLELKELGLVNAVVNHQISVYPNPTINTLQIKSEAKVLEYTITNVKGQLVQQNKVNMRNQLQIDVNLLVSGVYFIKVTTEIGVEVHQFIKN